MLTLHPYTPQYEEHRWYLLVMRYGEIEAYHAAYNEAGHWRNASGADLTDDGWQLVALTEELPLLAPGRPLLRVLS